MKACLGGGCFLFADGECFINWNSLYLVLNIKKIAININKTVKTAGKTEIRFK